MHCIGLYFYVIAGVHGHTVFCRQFLKTENCQIRTRPPTVRRTREFLPDRSWDLRGILHPADNRPRLLVLTAIAVPTWVGLLVFAGLFLDTAWDATPVLPPAIGPRCVAATVWPTLPVSAQPTWSHAVLQTLVLPSLRLGQSPGLVAPRVSPPTSHRTPSRASRQPPLDVPVCNPFRAAPVRIFLC